MALPPRPVRAARTRPCVARPKEAIMNTKVLTARAASARRPTTLVRVWRSTGGRGTPLTSRWIEVPAAAPLGDSANEDGGLWLCA